MKKIITIVVFLCAILSFSSCRNGKQIYNVVKKEYKALNESDAYKSVKARLRYERAKEYLNSSYTYSLCSQCNGYGFLYLTDENGYAILDDDGNLSLVECDNCNGNGYVED